MERPPGSWGEKLAKGLPTGAEWYRGWLFDEGREVRDEDGQLKRRGIDRETVERVVKEGGKLSRGQLVRCRVRYFSHGVAIGGRAFIEKVFQERRECFGPQRKDGARPIREAEAGLFAMRALRRRAVE